MASPSSSHAPSPIASTSSAPPVAAAKRASKACEACRIRRARCTGETPACDRCRTQGIGCRYREKARPGRAGPRAALVGAGAGRAAGAGRTEEAAGGKGVSRGEVTVGIRAVEEDVEALYLERTGGELLECGVLLRGSQRRSRANLDFAVQRPSRSPSPIPTPTTPCTPPAPFHLYPPSRPTKPPRTSPSSPERS